MAFQIAQTLTSRAALSVARPGAASMVLRRGFQLLTPAQQADATVPQFTVGRDNGFLPRQVRCLSLSLSLTTTV